MLYLPRRSAALVTALLLFGTLPAVAADKPTGREPITIGVFLPLSGPFARYGQKIQAAISGFESDRIRFQFEDEGCDPKKAVSAYKSLSDLRGIKIFIGPWCGSPQTAVAPMLKAKGQIALLGSSASEAVFALSGGRMFSTQHSIEAESLFLADQLNERGVKSVAIVFFENHFSRAHEAAFRSRFAGRIFETFAYTSEDLSELKVIALRVKQLKPAALYVPDAFPLMGGFLGELNTVGLSALPLYSVYSSQSDDVRTVVGKSGVRVHYSYPAIGSDDALDYFPTLAAKIIAETAVRCGEDPGCFIETFRKSQPFDQHGVLVGGFEIRTLG